MLEMGQVVLNTLAELFDLLLADDIVGVQSAIPLVPEANLRL